MPAAMNITHFAPPQHLAVLKDIPISAARIRMVPPTPWKSPTTAETPRSSTSPDTSRVTGTAKPVPHILPLRIPIPLQLPHTRQPAQRTPLTRIRIQSRGSRSTRSPSSAPSPVSAAWSCSCLSAAASSAGGRPRKRVEIMFLRLSRCLLKNAIRCSINQHASRRTKQATMASLMRSMQVPINKRGTKQFGFLHSPKVAIPAVQTAWRASLLHLPQTICSEPGTSISTLRLKTRDIRDIATWVASYWFKPLRYCNRNIVNSNVGQMSRIRRRFKVISLN